MTRYLEASIPARSFGYEPYTIDEIDAHLDSNRLWATIKAIRQEAQETIREAQLEGWEEGYEQGKGTEG